MSSNRFRCCAYCNVHIHRNQTTKVPIQQSIRQEWFDVLGENFAISCNAKKDAAICLTHFAVIRNGKRPLKAIPIPLPFCNNDYEKVKKPAEKKINSNLKKVNVGYKQANSAEIEANNNNTLQERSEPIREMIEDNQSVEPMEEEYLSSEESEHLENVEPQTEVTHKKSTFKDIENVHHTIPEDLKQKPILICTLCGFACENKELFPESGVTTFVCKTHYPPPEDPEPSVMNYFLNALSAIPQIIALNEGAGNQTNQTEPYYMNHMPSALSIMPPEVGVSNEEGAKMAEKEKLDDAKSLE